MRKLIVSTLVSLDGVAADPRSWAGGYFDEDAVQRSLAQLTRSDAMLMGRTTYEYFQPAWSVMPGPYADRINAIRKYVFSSSLGSVDWNNAALIPGDVVDAVTELKHQGGGDLVVYGYGQLAQTLLEHDLVDELDFWVHPVILGRGTPLFRHGKTTTLRLISVDHRPAGVAVLRFTRAADDQEA